MPSKLSGKLSRNQGQCTVHRYANICAIDQVFMFIFLRSGGAASYFYSQYPSVMLIFLFEYRLLLLGSFASDRGMGRGGGVHSRLCVCVCMCKLCVCGSFVHHLVLSSTCNSSCLFCISPITLVVAKCWDPNPKGYFTVPRQEPVRPIDPSAWVAHTTALREQYMGRGGPSAPSISNMTSTSSSVTSSIPESERELAWQHKVLHVHFCQSQICNSGHSCDGH